MQPLSPSSHFSDISQLVIWNQKLWLWRISLGETKPSFWFVWRSVLSPLQRAVTGRDLEESSSLLYSSPQTAEQGSPLPVGLMQAERWTTAANRNLLHSIQEFASFSSPWLLLLPLVPPSLLLHFLIKNAFILTPFLTVFSSHVFLLLQALSLHECGWDLFHTSAAVPVVSMAPYE